MAVHAVSQDDLARLSKPIDEQSIVKMLQTWVPVKYCPWCGRKLSRFYRKLWRRLHDESVSKDHGWGTTL